MDIISGIIAISMLYLTYEIFFNNEDNNDGDSHTFI